MGKNSLSFPPEIPIATVSPSVKNLYEIIVSWISSSKYLIKHFIQHNFPVFGLFKEGFYVLQ